MSHHLSFKLFHKNSKSAILTQLPYWRIFQKYRMIITFLIFRFIDLDECTDDMTDKKVINKLLSLHR